MTESASATEFVKWDDFQKRFVWKQGEHLTAIGPTGSGKTTLVNHLSHKRDYIIFAATKKVDKTVDWLKKNEGFRQIKTLDRLHPDVYSRYIYKPDFPHLPAQALRQYHANFFRELLMYVFRNGHWTLDLDEVRYLTEFLRLTEEYELLLLQGRSLGITVISKSQRPRKIPLTAYDQATHLFFWKDNDAENLKRIASLGAEFDARQIRREVSTMSKHEVLYLHRDKGIKMRTKVEI